VFRKYDADASGAIDKKELPHLLRELNLGLSPELYEKYCDKFMKDADLDQKYARSVPRKSC
jgi:Ca2+-binding EF-hand superfamily protein